MAKFSKERMKKYTKELLNSHIFKRMGDDQNKQRYEDILYMVLVKTENKYQYDFSVDIENTKQKWAGKEHLFQPGYEMANEDTSNGHFCHVKLKGAPHSKDCKHRIYVNPAPEDRYEFIELFLQKCQEKGVKCYFKYDRNHTDRDDTFLIYATDEQMAEYMEIMEEIEKERPDMIARMRNSPCASKQYGWYGYAPEVSSEFSYTERANKELINYVEYCIANRIKSFAKCPEKLYKNSGFLDRLDRLAPNAQARKRAKEMAKIIAEDLVTKNISYNDIVENKVVGKYRTQDGDIIEVRAQDVVAMIEQVGMNFESQQEEEKFYENMAKGSQEILRDMHVEKEMPKKETKTEKTK